MKLIIDIDDSLYDAIQTEFYVNGMRSGKTLLEKLTTTIRNGTPLDDIKLEIPTLSHWQTDDGQDLLMVADALECIDKHTGKGQSE